MGVVCVARQPIGNQHAGNKSDMELTDRLVVELIESVKQVLKRETSERLREVYLVGDIDKDSARQVIERMRELVNDNTRPITLYLNTAGGNVTDGLAVHDSIREIVSRGCEVTIVVQGMAYSMGSVLLQAASVGRRLAFPHAWIMIHEPAKWAGWQSTTAAQHHLDRLRQMQDQIYRILAKRSGRPLKQIIRDTRRNDFYLDARRALAYGLIDAIVESAADADTDLVARSEPLRHGQRPEEPNTARVAAAGEDQAARPDPADARPTNGRPPTWGRSANRPLRPSVKSPTPSARRRTQSRHPH
jgi:ATP-dependent Clp protease, protease subunit